MKCQITIALCAALAASGTGCTDNPITPIGDLGQRDQAGRAADMTDLSQIDPLAGNPQVVKLNLGMTFKYAQSPLWVPSQAMLLFSDTQTSMVYQVAQLTTLGQYRPTSSGSNGLALDGKGNLIVCEWATHQLTKRSLAGAATYESIVSTYLGTALNGPNDVTVRSDGTIYFTDPGSGPLGAEGLYRVAPGTSTAVQLDKGMQFPNGLALSPDEKSLYVAAATSGKVYKFVVNTDGSLGTRSDFAQGLFSCGGLTVDDAGNVYVATPAGVRVLRDDGTPRGSLAVSEVVTNLGFGGPDRKTLFITSPMSVFSVPLQIPGRP